MDKTIKKIGIILLAITLLPAAFFLAYEYNSLNENEEMLESIYVSQLDAILFSVNQYSEDVVRSYAASITSKMAEKSVTIESLRKVLDEAEALVYAAVADTFPAAAINDIVLDTASAENFRQDLSDVLKQNQDRIKRLYTYQRGGFQKFEPVHYKNYICLFFIIPDGRLCTFFLNPAQFINDVLAPRIRTIARDQFVLKVSEGNQLIYSTENDTRPPQFSRSLWLAPDYELGILMKGATIEELVKERFYTNLIIILLLGIILIIGVWIVFRNIKREIELAKIKSDFVSNVSHELRTPLALISMFAETLDMGRVRSEERKKEYLRIISQETNRLSRIVNKILSFSKMEAGKRTFTFTNADINEPAAKVYETYSFHLQNHGFKSSFNPAENLPAVNLDTEAFSEALINLIDNAMKYSEDVKEVNISTGLKDGYVYIEVRDKGVGISEENQKKIFDKFFRVTSGLVHNTKGTGLGLTLVKHIVEAHKGKIDVSSKLWEGSCFRLNFPVNKN